MHTDAATQSTYRWRGCIPSALRCVAVLALHGFYEKPGFVHYLEYLLYWKRPEYAKFLMYPHALTFLSLLQDQSYRERVGPTMSHFHVSPTLQRSLWRGAVLSFLGIC